MTPDHTLSCPICAAFVTLVKRTCPNKPTDASKKWVCDQPIHVTGQFYVDNWNKNIELVEAPTIGIGAIADE